MYRVCWPTACGNAAIRPIKDPIRRRDIYALLPPGDRHPLARYVLDALTEAARELDAGAYPGATILSRQAGDAARLPETRVLRRVDAAQLTIS